MGILLFMIGFFGFFVFSIRLIIGFIRRNTRSYSKKFELIGLGLCFILFISGALLVPSNPNQDVSVDKEVKSEPKKNEEVKKESKEVEPIKKDKKEIQKVDQKKRVKEKKVKKQLELDKLQELYLSFNDDITKEDIENKLVDSDLTYSEHKYSTGPSIKIALTEDQAKHKYAYSGDYIEVSFNKELEVETVTYFNNDKFLTLIDYRQGTYWDLRDQPQYKGYYVSKPGGKLGEFIVKYDNGRETDTGYLKVDSKQDQLEYLFKYK